MKRCTYAELLRAVADLVESHDLYPANISGGGGHGTYSLDIHPATVFQADDWLKALSGYYTEECHQPERWRDVAGHNLPDNVEVTIYRPLADEGWQ